MDLAMMVERMRQLSEAGAVDALQKLLATPDVRAIAQAYIATTMDDPTMAARWCKKLSPRDPEAMWLLETELEPETVHLLAGAGIETIGEARRATDERLLALKDISLYRLEDLRATCEKYLRGSKSTAGEPSRAERVSTRIRQALAEGASQIEVSRRLKVTRDDVRVVAAQTR